MKKFVILVSLMVLSLGLGFLLFSWIIRVSYVSFIDPFLLFLISCFISFSMIASVFILFKSFRDFIKGKLGSKIRFRLIVLFITAGLVSSSILSVIFISTIDAFKDVLQFSAEQRLSDVSKDLLNRLSFLYRDTFIGLEKALAKGRGSDNIYIVKFPYDYVYGKNGFLDVIWDQLKRAYSDEGKSLIVFGKDEYLFAFKKIKNGFLVSYTQIDSNIYDIKVNISKILKVSSSLEFLFYEVFGKYIVLIILLLNIPSFFISILVAYLFSEYISLGISRLANGMKEVSQGNLNYVVSNEGTIDEIRYLIDQFNIMTMKLLEAYYRLSKIEKIELWKDIARKFSHEIKNPLSPIKLSIQRILLNQDAEDFKERVISSLGIILEEVDRIDKLVTQLSNFAKIPLPNRSKFRFSDIMKHIKELFSYRDVEFEVIINGDDTIYADFDQIKQCLINLVKNGLEASEGISNKITIKFSKEEDRVIISVKDYGIGIPEDMGDKIFKPYTTTKKTGSGLGLSIVESIVLNHGGKVYFESKSGKGSEFFLEIPYEEK
ncbi:MAG: ATP-binding protein [Brevinematia bacterium]